MSKSFSSIDVDDVNDRGGYKSLEAIRVRENMQMRLLLLLYNFLFCSYY